MPTVMIERNLAGFDGDFYEMQEALVKLQKMLYWLLGQLDSVNVRRLSTNQTDIKSDDGNTHLNGTQIVMKDRDGTSRAVLGLNQDTGKFEFKLSNKNGTTTITLDDSGNAVFTGDVTASTITGGTITGTKITGGTVEGATIKGGSITSGTTIDVGTSASIGEKLVLKDGTVTGGTISVYKGTSPTLYIKGDGNRPIEINTPSTITLAANAVANQLGERFITEGYTGMYVTVDGVNYPVKFN